MYSRFVFLASIASIFNIILAGNTIQLKEVESQIRTRSRTSDGEYEVCTEDHISKRALLLEAFQDKIQTCKVVTKSEIELVMKKFRVETAEAIKNVQESIKDCSLGEDISEFLDCLKKFASVTTKALYPIKLKAEIIENDIKSIPDEEQKCLAKSLEEFEIKEKASLLEFQHCYQEKIRRSLNPVEELKMFYKDLEKCIKDKNYIPKCAKKDDAVDEKLVQYFTKNADKHFGELTRIDLSENICLRPFITGYVHPKFNSNFNLEQCVSQGMNEFTSLESDDGRILEEFGKLHSLLSRCKVVANNSHIDLCVSENLRNSMVSRQIIYKIHMMSEKNLSQLLVKIQSNFDTEKTCMIYIFDKLRFEGLFMNASSKQSLKECVEKHYISNEEPATIEVVIKRLEEIRNSISRCKTGAKFSKCIRDTIDANIISLNYITTSPSYFEYLERIKQHDETQNTSLLTIVKEYKDPLAIQSWIMDNYLNR